jgi:leishmanolysin-like peptidase
MIVTPRVVDEVRMHFNCSSLEGAELEDQGEIGTKFTHWEKRVFENEAMTGTYTQNSVFSRITFAFLEDTGWYTANYSNAEELSWGKDLGCGFSKKSCKSWIDEKRHK